jgi:hypothetical protein
MRLIIVLSMRWIIFVVILGCVVYWASSHESAELRQSEKTLECSKEAADGSGTFATLDDELACRQLIALRHRGTP